MSHVATKWAFDQPELHRDMKPGEWAVLMVLADCHNPVLGCFPSQEYLASKTNLGERAIRDQLAHLRERGLITWEETRKDGHRGWNRYRLAFEPDFQPANSAGSPTGEIAPEQPAKSDTTNRQNLPPNLVIEPVKEPERECAREAEQAQPGPASTETQPAETGGLTVDAAWSALGKVWPAFAAQSEALARPALSALTPAERKLAVERAPAFLVFHRETQGKAKLPFLHNYLGEKHRWQALPQAQPAVVATVERRTIGAFDQAWWWLFFDLIKRLGTALLDQRSPASVELRKHVDLARISIGWRVGAAQVEEIEAAAKTFVQVPVDGAEFKAWTVALAAAGVTLPRPDKAGWIFVPSQWPPDERERDEALRDEASEIMGVK